MGVSWRQHNSSMALFILIALTFFATTFAKLGCEDYSYDRCHEPSVTQSLHVAHLEECIQNCDLFGSFDQCDYLMYYGDNGPDENCKIISGSGTADEEMAKYLKACRVVGQPMKNTAGDCLEGPQDECFAGCSGGCADCTADKCVGYRGSECAINDKPGETIPSIESYLGCLSICTLQMDQDNDWTYLTYDQESQECICYTVAAPSCTIEVAKNGMKMADVNTCKA